MALDPTGASLPASVLVETSIPNLPAPSAAEASTVAQAAADLEAVATDLPGEAEAFALRGESLHAEGRFADAAEALHLAAALDPARIDVLDLLTETLTALGRRGEALGAWQRRLGPRPDCRRSRLEAAALLGEAGEAAAAADHYRAVLALDPDDGDALIGLAGIEIAAADFPAAIDRLQRRLRRRPDCARSHLLLGRSWARMMDAGRARTHLRRALDLDPEDKGGARGLLDRLGEEAGGGLTDDFIRCLFDQYAGDYDRNMVEVLGYRGPDAVLGALAAAGLAGRRWDEVLDLGCGTGLFGVRLRAIAGRLVGVDLSAGMVDKARRRRVYDDLEVAEMGAALARRQAACCDLIAAADVLIYVGDLTPLLAAAARVLRPGGVFAGTLEQAPSGCDVHLKESRRFGHSADHLRAGAAAAGLPVVTLEPVSYRRDRGEAVPGWVFVLEKEG